MSGYRRRRCRFSCSARRQPFPKIWNWNQGGSHSPNMIVVYWQASCTPFSATVLDSMLQWSALQTPTERAWAYAKRIAWLDKSPTLARMCPLQNAPNTLMGVATLSLKTNKQFGLVMQWFSENYFDTFSKLSPKGQKSHGSHLQLSTRTAELPQT